MPISKDHPYLHITLSYLRCRWIALNRLDMIRFPSDPGSETTILR